MRHRRFLNGLCNHLNDKLTRHSDASQNLKFSNRLDPEQVQYDDFGILDRRKLGLAFTGKTASNGTGRHLSVEGFKALAQGTAIRQRHPEAQEMAFVIFRRMIFKSRSGMQCQVIVEKLDIARLEHHGDMKIGPCRNLSDEI